MGSICAITNSNGNVVAEAGYDAWGRLRNPQTLQIYSPQQEPALFLKRGFTGHEHLKEYGLD